MKKIKSVFHDIGFSKSESAALTFKAEVYSKIIRVVKTKKISARELEKILDVPQPRISELLNQKLSGISIEKLLTYLEKLGITASAYFKSQKAS
ncbi:MAG: XRE family transcriptional regulator [Bdellovibrio sp.]|nr:XRE family transcriptional regulator [Bdellovibrio sp.]